MLGKPRVHWELGAYPVVPRDGILGADVQCQRAQQVLVPIVGLLCRKEVSSCLMPRTTHDPTSFSVLFDLDTV